MIDDDLVRINGPDGFCGGYGKEKTGQDWRQD